MGDPLLDFPIIDNPFYRESLHPLKPTAQQLNDRRYKPTVEAIYLRRSEHPEFNPPVLPREGKIVLPVRDGKPGDPNRHPSREVKVEKKQDEFFDFQDFDRQYNELRLRIEAIRQKSKMYPIWANDSPQLPTSINRKFGDLNQQLFNLKKCFVSPEEIMLDNTASMIQKLVRSNLRKNIFRKALKAIASYKHRELTDVHRTLNSWVAQMEFADSRAQQFRFRGLSKVSKYASKQWLKWAEREAFLTNRIEAKAAEMAQKFSRAQNQNAAIQWKEIATGQRSRKAMAQWRTSMVPKMKQELEKTGRDAPSQYIPLVCAYIEMRTERSFLFNFFIAWHARYHSKSLRETVGDRNAALLFKKHVLTRTFKFWLVNVRQTKEFLGTKEKWDRYIALSRAQHSAHMSVVSGLVISWHKYARSRVIIRNRRKMLNKRLSKKSFRFWKDTTDRHRDMKLRAVEIWKRTIQDPKIAVFRQWHVYAIRKKTQHEMAHMLMDSSVQWHNRKMIEVSFAKWQMRFSMNKNSVAAKALEKKKWELQATKQATTVLSGQYAKEREKIAAIESNLGDITSQFIKTEDDITKLEEITTTWKIALHAMKMEYIRLATAVEQCATPQSKRRRRMSDEDVQTRLGEDDRYMQTARTRLSVLQTSDRVVGKWKRRNSDPEIDPDQFIELKPPLDDSIIQLLQFDKN